MYQINTDERQHSLADQMDFLRAHFPRSSPLHQRLARLA